MGSASIFLSSLGSGSGGNAFVIESANSALIIDQGFSRKELICRMEQLGCDPAKLCGALLSHEHTDHCKGSRVFCDHLGIPLYTTGKTALYLRNRKQLPKLANAFEPGAAFSVGEFEIKSFPLPHDAVEPVGFTVSCSGVKIGIATDLGHASAVITNELKDCDALILESNYDLDMLMNSNRDLKLKRRICGVRGHLDNRCTGELIDCVVGEKTRLLLLAHISSECNCIERVKECCQKHLAERSLPQLQWEILSQTTPLGKFRLNCGTTLKEELF